MTDNYSIMADPCIEWHKSRDKAGYGHTRFRGKNMLAHRAAWIKAYGDIPEGMCVLHRCDNPSCCNQLHLFLGTQADNIQDCYTKGRISKASRNAGTSHGASKITEQTAVRLKMLHKVVPARILAEELGMNLGWIGSIMRGDVWKHVTAKTRYAF